MKKLFVCVIFAIIFNEAVGRSYRHKRQSTDEEENNLDDRYGWDRPSGRPQRRPIRPQNGGRQNWPGNQSWDNQNQQWQNQQAGQRPWGSLPNGQQWDGSGSQPNQNGQIGQPNQNQQNPGQSTQSPAGSTSQSPDTANCILNCPATAEYNPVCGSNMVTYNNPGRLVCAQRCGVSVSLQRSSPCPTTTTAAPAQAS